MEATMLLSEEIQLAWGQCGQQWCYVWMTSGDPYCFVINKLLHGVQTMKCLHHQL